MQTLEAPKPQRPRKTTKRDFAQLVSTRRGALLVAFVSAIFAAFLLMVFLNQYRRSLHSGDQGVTVLVAKSLIEKGSSGTVIAEKAIYQTARIKKDDVKNGAVADPAGLRGKVAVADIYPGQQLTVADFAPATGGIRDQLTGDQRAVSLPLDNAHGMIGDVQTGDHVDVYVVLRAAASNTSGVNRSVLRTLIQDTMVLRAPKKPKPGASGPMNTDQIILRATDSQATKLAFASENGKLWIVLRPKLGSEQGPPQIVTEPNLLTGKTIRVTPEIRAALTRGTP